MTTLWSDLTDDERNAWFATRHRLLKRERQMPLTEDQRKARELRKYLKNLTVSVASHIAALDAEMKKPPDESRGQRIAALCNSLEIDNDRAWHFGLGLSLGKNKR